MGAVIAVVPAHDEVAELPKAVEALRAQTRPPDRIILVVNNPAGPIEEAARSTGAEYRVIPRCPGLKAGALNQVFDELLPRLGDEDVVLVQDADSYLDATFVESALAAYADGVGAVGGTFRGRVAARRCWGRAVEFLQANEYARYELDIRRRRGRVLVLTGTATLVRAGILRELLAARTDGRLPGQPHVYDTKVLTEDNELSFALMHLGYRLVSPKGCTLTTETMPTWRALGRQRLRWKRGALENLFDYGWTPITRGYWWRQIVGGLGVLVSAGYVVSLLVGLAVGLRLQPVWLVVTALFALERSVTVRRRGIGAIAVAAVVMVETSYDLFLQATQTRAYLEILMKRQRAW